MKRQIKIITALLLIMVMLPISSFVTNDKTAEASTKYITVESFVTYITKELGLSSVSGKERSGYVNALIEKGIIKTGDFTSYTKYLTRGDAALLLNRADEYLYGDTLDAELIDLALDKRISDIGIIKESKRIDVVKAYLKGFIKGYSNGNYSTDRTLKVSSKITKTGALDCIKLLKGKTLRAKISPDGQLIRTTKLPKYAKNYPYILASYPNSYYDWKFCYEGVTRTRFSEKTGKMEDVPFYYITDYASPADVDKTTRIDNFAEVKKERLDIWVNKVKTHMESIFNVDYRTIGKEWIDTVSAVHYTYGYWMMEEQTRKRLENFVANMKGNQTIVESSNVAVDGSSLYYFDCRYYLRVYVRYRIMLSKTQYKPMELYDDNNIFYTNYPINFIEFDIGEWKECCYDVALTNYTNDEKANLGVLYALLTEGAYADRKIK